MQRRRHISSEVDLKAELIFSYLTKENDRYDESIISSFTQNTDSLKRDTLIELIKLKKNKARSADISRLLEFIESAFPTHPGQKPQFYEKYYKILFQCTGALAAESKVQASRRILEMLMGSLEKNNPASYIDLKTLHDVTEVCLGLNAILEDATSNELLINTYPRWSGLVPELSSKGPEDIAVSKCAARNILKVLATSHVKLDSAIRLSLPVLVSYVDGDLPDEFPGSGPAYIEQTIRSSISMPMQNEPYGSNSVAPPPPESQGRAETRCQLPALEEITTLITERLAHLDQSLSERLNRQESELSRLKEESSRLDTQITKKDLEISNLDTQKARILQDLDQARLKVEETRKELDEANTLLEDYKKSHIALEENVAHQVSSAEQRVKREFQERAGRQMTYLRDYLEKAVHSSTSEALNPVVSNFNTLVRKLENSGYLVGSPIKAISMTNGGTT